MYEKIINIMDLVYDKSDKTGYWFEIGIDEDGVYVDCNNKLFPADPYEGRVRIDEKLLSMTDEDLKKERK